MVAVDHTFGGGGRRLMRGETSSDKRTETSLYPRSNRSGGGGGGGQGYSSALNNNIFLKIQCQGVAVFKGYPAMIPVIVCPLRPESQGAVSLLLCWYFIS